MENNFISIDPLQDHYLIMIWMQSGKKHIIRGVDEVFLKNIVDTFKVRQSNATAIITFKDGNWNTCIDIKYVEAISVLSKYDDRCDNACFETKCKNYCQKDNK